jgi:electron transfer flavoprotein alpha subunit
VILTLVEGGTEGLSALSAQALTLARGLAGDLGVPLHAVTIGAEELADAIGAGATADVLGAYGVATVHVIRHERLDTYVPRAWAVSLAGLVDELAPAAVLAAGSERGNEVMAHLGSLTGLSVAANCTSVAAGDPLVVIRMRWGGSLLEEARLSGAVKLLTVAPHAVAAEPAPERARTQVREMTPSLDERDLRVRVTGRVAAEAGKVTLPEAKVVVGGGRGVGSAEGFAALEELAGLLGGVVGVSRVVTSAGWRPHADQVGQTGARIAPEIYIACGISGAIQHMVGCKGAKRILAINTDADAPIVGKADYAVIGDLHAVLPALISEIQRTRPEAS